jgi:tetratricopeptide (TPR) repeat protein
VRVRFGPEATDEMGELLLQLLPAAGGDFASLRTGVARKELSGNVAGDEKRIADAPDDAQARNSLGVAYYQMGRVDDALVQLNEALRLEPEHTVANFNVALIAMMQGRLEEAATHLQRAIAVRPDYAEAHNNLGVVLMRQGSFDPAIAQFQEVLRIHPDGGDAHYNLARALLASGRVNDAVDHLRRAVAARPDAPAMLGDLSWILATSPDDRLRSPKEAVTLAERAAELTGRKVAAILDTLGAAYASAGQYEQAAQAAREAFDLASDADQSEIATAFLKRLDLYRQRLPYRDQAEVK